MKLKIFLARHGQTDWNAEFRLQGWTDIPLNETGRKQAMELAKRLEGIQLDRIYCSALKRSHETALVVATAKGIPVVILPELNEQSLGAYEGIILKEDVEKEFHRRREDFDDSLDGGESRRQHAERIRTALEIIQNASPDGGQILIVGHGGTNNLILRIFFAEMEDVTFRFGNSDIVMIHLDGATARYEALPKENI